jgi:hypothetical protein
MAATVPWEAPDGDVSSAWDSVAETMRSAGYIVDGKRVKAPGLSLIKAWRTTSTAEERQSGVRVAYDERHSVLEEITTRTDDWKSNELLWCRNTRE